jgi:hypothetical protein
LLWFSCVNLKWCIWTCIGGFPLAFFFLAKHPSSMMWIFVPNFKHWIMNSQFLLMHIWMQIDTTFQSKLTEFRTMHGSIIEYMLLVILQDFNSIHSIWSYTCIDSWISKLFHLYGCKLTHPFNPNWLDSKQCMEAFFSTCLW